MAPKNFLPWNFTKDLYANDHFMMEFYKGIIFLYYGILQRNYAIYHFMMEFYKGIIGKLPFYDGNL